jgi:hypothetical protein
MGNSDTITREILAERWETATTRYERRRDAQGYAEISETNSKAVEHFYTVVEDLAAPLAEGATSADMADLCVLAGNLLAGPIREALFAWAERTPARRHEEWLAMRAEAEAKAALRLGVTPEEVAANRERVAAEIKAENAVPVA